MSFIVHILSGYCSISVPNRKSYTLGIYKHCVWSK